MPGIRDSGTGGGLGRIPTLYSVVQWRTLVPFFLAAAPLKWSSQKRVPFFSRVTEQLSLKIGFA